MAKLCYYAVFFRKNFHIQAKNNATLLNAFTV